MPYFVYKHHEEPAGALCHVTYVVAVGHSRAGVTSPLPRQRDVVTSLGG